MPRDYQTIYRAACLGNGMALDFLFAWNEYCHAIDDMVDEPKKSGQKFIDSLAMANALYSCDFYQQYAGPLRAAVVLATNDYEDSIEWSNNETAWKKTWADTLRFAGNHMVLAVACICGGYTRMRKVSLQLREDSFMNHHCDGQPG